MLVKEGIYYSTQMEKFNGLLSTKFLRGTNVGKSFLVVLACSVGITLGTSLGTGVLFTKIYIYFLPNI